MCAARASRSIEEPETQCWVFIVDALLLLQVGFCDARFYVCYQSFYTDLLSSHRAGCVLWLLSHSYN